MNTIDKDHYPSIFAETPSPLVSQKYQFIKTSDVLETLYDLGWDARQMTEVKARKPHTKGFQKHLIRLSKPGFKPSEVGDEVPELVLTNSHNGKNSFSFRIGIYRMICSNGLIVPTEEFTNITIKHIGNMASQIQEVVEKMSSSFASVYSDIKKMKERKLTPIEVIGFAKRASRIRNLNLLEESQTTLQEILKSQRPEDNGEDLWKTFNRIQENLIQGNFDIKTKKGTRRGTSIKSIDRSIKMNEELWNLAKTYIS